MAAHEAVCQECGETVTGRLIHLGFSERELLYCSSCARGLLLRPPDLDGLRTVTAADPRFEPFNNHLIGPWRAVESTLPPCPCGGSFKYLNPPRCPYCHGLLRGDCYHGRIIDKERDYQAFLPSDTLDLEDPGS